MLLNTVVEYSCVVKFQIPHGRGYLPIPLEAFDGKIEDCVRILRDKKMLGIRTDKLTLRMVYDEIPPPPESDVESSSAPPAKPSFEPLFLEDEDCAQDLRVKKPSGIRGNATRMFLDRIPVLESDIESLSALAPVKSNFEPFFPEEDVPTVLEPFFAPIPEGDISRLRGVSPAGSKRSREERDDSSEGEGEGDVTFT